MVEPIAEARAAGILWNALGGRVALDGLAGLLCRLVYNKTNTVQLLWFYSEWQVRCWLIAAVAAVSPLFKPYS